MKRKLGFTILVSLLFTMFERLVSAIETDNQVLGVKVGFVFGILATPVKLPLWSRALPLIYLLALLVFLFSLFYVLVVNVPAFRNNKRAAMGISIALALIVGLATPFPSWFHNVMNWLGMGIVLGMLIGLGIGLYFIARALGKGGQKIYYETAKEANAVRKLALAEEKEAKKEMRELNKEKTLLKMDRKYLKRVEKDLDKLEKNLKDIPKKDKEKMEGLDKIADAIQKLAGHREITSNPKLFEEYKEKLSAAVTRLVKEDEKLKDIEKSIQELNGQIKVQKGIINRINRNIEDFEKEKEDEIKRLEKEIGKLDEELKNSEVIGRGEKETEKKKLEKDLKTLNKDLEWLRKDFKNKALPLLINESRKLEPYKERLEEEYKKLREIEQAYIEYLDNLIRYIREGDWTGALEAIKHAKDVLIQKERIIVAITSVIEDVKYLISELNTFEHKGVYKQLVAFKKRAKKERGTEQEVGDSAEKTQQAAK